MISLSNHKTQPLSTQAPISYLILGSLFKKNPDDKVLILKVKVFLRNILILLIEQI